MSADEDYETAEFWRGYHAAYTDMIRFCERQSEENIRLYFEVPFWKRWLVNGAAFVMGRNAMLKEFGRHAASSCEAAHRAFQDELEKENR